MKEYEEQISRILKQSRRENGFSAEYVVNELKRYGITISAKTIYGYETTQNQPNADMFVALCKIYGIKTLDIFFDDDTSEVVNPTITKYNSLNSSGKRKADEYITDLSEQKKYTAADAEPNELVKNVVQSAVKDSMQIKNNINR